MSFSVSYCCCHHPMMEQEEHFFHKNLSLRRGIGSPVKRLTEYLLHVLETGRSKIQSSPLRSWPASIQSTTTPGNTWKATEINKPKHGLFITRALTVSYYCSQHPKEFLAECKSTYHQVHYLAELIFFTQQTFLMRKAMGWFTFW